VSSQSLMLVTFLSVQPRETYPNMLARSESIPRPIEARVQYGLCVAKASKVLQKLTLPLYKRFWRTLSRSLFV